MSATTPEYTSGSGASDGLGTTLERTTMYLNAELPDPGGGLGYVHDRLDIPGGVYGVALALVLLVYWVISR